MRAEVETVLRKLGGGGDKNSQGGEEGERKLQKKEDKRKIMGNKWRLRGEEIWVEDDLTWEKRKTRWKLIQVMKKEEEKGEIRTRKGMDRGDMLDLK